MKYYNISEKWSESFSLTGENKRMEIGIYTVTQMSNIYVYEWRDIILGSVVRKKHKRNHWEWLAFTRYQNRNRNDVLVAINSRFRQIKIAKSVRWKLKTHTHEHIWKVGGSA